VQKLRNAARILLPVAVLAAAAWALTRELRGFSFRDVEVGLSAIPTRWVLLAALATAVDYLLLAGYDLLALRWVERRLPLGRVVFTSFIAYAFGNNVGFALLSSSSVRVRLYSQWGLAPGDIARVVAFTAIQLWAGLLPLLGVALLAGAPGPLPPLAAKAVGLLSLALTLAYLLLARRGADLTVRGFTVRPPSLPLAAGQVLVSAADWTLAALVLWLLLPQAAAMSFTTLLGLFIVAQVGGLASQVPGGLGVFDTIVVAALTPSVSPAEALSCVFAYRLIYYIAPFLAAFLMLVGNELVVRREQVGRVMRGAHASFAPVVPWLAALGAMVAGTVLLLSGVLPAEIERVRILRRVVPLPVLEASHLIGSVVGTGLLVLARGLSRRLDGAWMLAIGLLGAGAVVSLAKGLDYEEAILLTLVLAALLPFRKQFYRRSSLLDEPLNASWTVAVVAILAASVWIAVFVYRQPVWSRTSWLRFAFSADAPRALRASVLGVSALALYGVAVLLRPRAPEPHNPTPDELARARPLIDAAAETLPHLALAGDKPLLFSKAGDAFLSYAVEGRSWIAMGDPVGPERAATELAWTLRELADHHGGWAVFYQVGPAGLPRYLDMGLALFRLGEEAVVPLQDFSIEGGPRRPLRTSYRRAERDGLSFEVVPAPGVAALLPELRAISDSWLEEKNVREKGFSVGAFGDRYLCEGPLAVARLGGRIVAFANLWAPASRAELSFDLMRHAPGVPNATMDYLFVSIMLWGREQGFETFSLGMAPLSGLEDRTLAPLWTKVGARLFRHGEYFYNFQGLRQYKEKYLPEWRPRYLAAPGGIRLPFVLANVAAVVSRGLKGVVAR
jgi:phosphatidylglycerol lysyltransferase